MSGDPIEPYVSDTSFKRTVWKFPLTIGDDATIIHLVNPSPVHVGLDPSGVPCVWIEHAIESDLEPHRVALHVHGTGHPFREETWHLGSFVQGPFVWHVYMGYVDQELAGQQETGTSGDRGRGATARPLDPAAVDALTAAEVERVQHTFGGCSS